MSKLHEKIRTMAQNNVSILEGMLLLASEIEALKKKFDSPMIKTVFDPKPALHNLILRLDELEDRIDENK